MADRKVILFLIVWLLPLYGNCQTCPDSLILNQVFGLDTSYAFYIIDSHSTGKIVNAKNVLLESKQLNKAEVNILDDEFDMFPNAVSLEIYGKQEFIISTQSKELAKIKLLSIMAPFDLKKLPESFVNCKVEYLLIWGDTIPVTGIPDAILKNNNIQFLYLTLSGVRSHKLWIDLKEMSKMEKLNCVSLHDFRYSKRKYQKLKRHLRNHGINIFVSR